MKPIPTIRLASEAEAATLLTMYHEMIDQMGPDTWHTQWRKGVYPTEADFVTAARKGELYVAELNAQLAAAVVMNHHCHPEYAAVNWQVQCPPHQVGCIHTLGVSVQARHCGVATALMRYVAAAAQSKGCKCLRLDLIETARPIAPFYRSLGFCFRETRYIEYDSVCANFDMYELLL